MANRVVMDEALHQAKRSIDKIEKKVDKLISKKSFQGEPVQTRTYIDCTRLSEDLAWQAETPQVRWQDLMWAILLRGKESPKFKKFCRDVDITLEAIREFLEQRYPKPEMPNPDSIRTTSYR